ncbi:methyl-accepting chemotaxis protein [Cohnella candidum]|uniref:Methyl-accepting chemotaxis protein n=1 Tax=Cohnella candidum TaxID=2674991 RepID=A0A3G3K3U2_9BACL|nr:methyl-accepting chemotaxis protein [Cohnella candidum]AYQ75225.1 methyl-accepting chemotaxis protein [Cohnella candidum]
MRIPAIRSIRTRIMLIVLPVVVAAMAALSAITYQNSKTLINREIESKMQQQLDATIQSIQTRLTAHAKIPETLARAVEASADHIEQEALIDMIMKFLSANADTFGVGVWFEPRQYKQYLEYFGPYAYRFNGQVQYTLESSTKEYDYPSRQFYRIGRDTDRAVVWSDPYYDESSKSDVLTATAPFYHYDKKFRGVVTANVDLESLQQAVASIRVGETGRAFLLDKQGDYIADRDGSKLLKVNIAQDANRGLASLGQVILASPDGLGEYADEEGKVRVYYAEVPLTGWKLALQIPERELYRPLRQLLIQSILAIALTLLAVSLVIYLFARYTKRQISQVSRLSAAMAAGDFTQTAAVRSRDEIGEMAADFNRMTRELGAVIRQMNDSAELVAGTSEQLTLSTEQTTKAAEGIAEAVLAVAAGSDEQVRAMSAANGKAADTSSRLDDISCLIESMAGVSSFALRTAAEGHETLRAAVDHVHDVDGKVRRAADIIESLHAKSRDIDDTMELIGRVSFQTRILALNAGIAASQAGAHGKAFMVIAEEIRGLAENSANSGSRIQETVGEIRREIQLAKELMDANLQAVDGGKTKIESAAQSFGRIVHAVQEVSEQTDGVSDAIGEIRSHMSDMAETVRQMTEIARQAADQTGSVSASTEEQMASMQEIAAGAGTLASLANELKRTINRFAV